METLVPLGLGLRYYPLGRSRIHLQPHPRPLPQPYIEASPAVFWLHNDFTDRLLPGGLFGLVVPGRIAARVGFELGLFYLVSRSSDVGGRSFPGMNHLSMAAGLWFTT